VVDFLQFVVGEARSYSMSLKRLSAEMDDLRRVDFLFQCLPTRLRNVSGGMDWSRFLEPACRVRLYTSTLAYMRGQRGDMYGITRTAVEAAINAALLRKGILTIEQFDEGGRAILCTYRAVSNPQNPSHCPELKHLLDTRSKLSKWGSHAELASLIFRVSEGSQAGEQQFQFFEIAKDDGEYRYLFLVNLVTYTDILGAFGGLWAKDKDASAEAFQKEVTELRGYLAAKAFALKVPDMFGTTLERLE